MEDARYMVARSYPDDGVCRLDIMTRTPLPDKFFDEFNILLSKYGKEVPIPNIGAITLNPQPPNHQY